jgi:hypothetical protein
MTKTLLTMGSWYCLPGDKRHRLRLPGKCSHSSTGPCSSDLGSLAPGLLGPFPRPSSVRRPSLDSSLGTGILNCSNIELILKSKSLMLRNNSRALVHSAIFRVIKATLGFPWASSSCQVEEVPRLCQQSAGWAPFALPE